MAPIAPRRSRAIRASWMERALVYVRRFDIVPKSARTVERSTGLHVLKRAIRANNSPVSQVFPLDQIRSYAHVVPRFGPVADVRLTAANSNYASQFFYLNKYFDKDFFYAVSNE